jgi:hypothetical protein
MKDAAGEDLFHPDDFVHNRGFVRHAPLIIRIVLIICLIVAWRWLAVAHPQWAGGIGRIGDRPIYGGGWAALAILSFYVTAYSVILLRNRHKGGYDAQMFRGCGLFILAVLAIGWLLLAIGMFFHIKWLVVVVGLVTILSAFPIFGGLAAEGWKAWKKRREN